MTAQEIALGIKILKEWKKVQKEGYKSFFISQNEKEFYERIPEEIYSIYDHKGNFIADLLETDYIDFYDKNIIINTNDYVLQGVPEGYPVDVANYFVNKEHKDAIAMVKVQRVVIVILDEPKWKRHDDNAEQF